MSQTSKLAVLGASAVLAAIAACQTIAGIDDKRLAPSGSGGTNSTDAGGDAESDGAPDVDAGLDAGRQGAVPPERPAGNASPSGKGKVMTLAVRRFYLGTVDPETDEISFDAWRGFGFDYDGECTTKEQATLKESKTCILPEGGQAFALEDGYDCRDNAAGYLLQQVMLVADFSFEKKVHKGTLDGTAQTLLLQIKDLDDGPDDPYAPGTLYVTAPKDGGMVWDGDDQLDIDIESVVDGGLDESKYELPRAYVRDNVWVSGDFRGPPIVVPMMVLKVIAPVPTQSATMTVTFDEEHLHPQGGMFSAAVKTLSIEPMLRAGLLDATNCDEGKADLGMTMFTPNRDLANDEDFVNPDEECGLLSMGVGLDLARVKPPANVVAVPKPPLPCDAGQD